MAGTDENQSIDLCDAARPGQAEPRFRLFHARRGAVAIALGAGMALGGCAQESGLSIAGPQAAASIQPVALSQDGAEPAAVAPGPVGGQPEPPPAVDGVSASRATPKSPTGLASWYGDRFHGRTTANGERFDMETFTAAHRSFPLPSYVRVTNVLNGRSIVVRVNDRGPYHGERVIDVSRRTADVLGFRGNGVGTVKLDYVGKAPAQSDDMRLLASYQEFGRPRAPEGTQMAALEPVSDRDLAAEAGSGGGAFALASAAVKTSVAAVSSSAAAVASTARAAIGAALPATDTTRRDARPAAIVAAAPNRGSGGPEPYSVSAYASSQPLIPVPTAITESKPASQRVVAPSAPLLASATPSSGVDVASRIASSFESFGGSNVQIGGSVTVEGTR